MSSKLQANCHELKLYFLLQGAASLTDWKTLVYTK